MQVCLVSTSKLYALRNLVLRPGKPLHTTFYDKDHDIDTFHITHPSKSGAKRRKKKCFLQNPLRKTFSLDTPPLVFGKLAPKGRGYLKCYPLMEILSSGRGKYEKKNHIKN